VNIAMGGSAPTLAQPHVQQQGVVPQEAVPGYRPQFASSQGESAGLDAAGTGKFTGLSQPLLLGADAQPAWTGNARSTVALVMSLPGNDGGRLAADTSTGKRGQGATGNPGQTSAGQRSGASGSGTGAGSAEGAQTKGASGSAASKGRPAPEVPKASRSPRQAAAMRSAARFLIYATVCSPTASALQCRAYGNSSRIPSAVRLPAGAGKVMRS
jgi:hypothetical protein